MIFYMSCCPPTPLHFYTRIALFILLLLLQQEIIVVHLDYITHNHESQCFMGCHDKFEGSQDG